MLKPFQDPVLRPDELKAKITALNREVQYLLNKAKTAKRKPKADKEKDEKKANDTTTIPPVDKTESDETVTKEGEETAEEAPPTADEVPPTEEETPSSEEATETTESPQAQEAAPE